MKIILKAEKREHKEILDKDFLPAVIYGHGQEAVSLKLKRSELEKTIKEAGESNLITLILNGGEKQVLIKEVQRNGVSGIIIHVDLFEVNMKEMVQTEIPINFIGESKAVKELSGLLMKDMDSLPVECLPGNLIDHLDIDISSLNEYHDEITTEDIVLPEGIRLTNLEKRIIANVLPPKKIVEEVKATPEAAPSEPIK